MSVKLLQCFREASTPRELRIVRMGGFFEPLGRNVLAFGDMKFPMEGAWMPDRARNPMVVN